MVRTTANEELSDGVQDRVVREFDVCLCNGVLGTDTQLYLLQYPLRPPWRPYDFAGCDKANFKPNAKRLELTAGLDLHGPNFNTDSDAAKQLGSLPLKSQSVDMPTTFAIASIRGDKLVLSPLNQALQMRPQLDHLNTSKKKDKDEDEDEEEEKKPEWVAVQVQRRETERQTEQRLNSYAFLSQQESDEKWKQLKCSAAESEVAAKVWDKLTTPAEQDAVSENLSRPHYLATIIPSTTSSQDPGAAWPHGNQGSDVGVTGQPVGPAAVASQAGLKAAEHGAQSSEQASMANGASDSHGGKSGTLPAATTKALSDALVVLLKKHSVVNQTDIRQWLASYEEAGAASELASADDNQLHAALMQTGLFLSARKLYFLRKVSADGGPADSLRALLASLFQEKTGVRRAEVMDSARAGNLTVSDSLYQRVIKDLCISRGNIWSLKPGAS